MPLKDKEQRKTYSRHYHRNRWKIDANYREQRRACNRKFQRVMRARLKYETLIAYGGPVCVCCGETDTDFLSIEHSRRDGSLRRKENGSGTIFYMWLKKNNYPRDLGLEVLCMNCQIGRKINGGIYPHESNTS